MSIRFTLPRQEIKDAQLEKPTMQEIRYLDKLIDELANGKAMEKILREIS